MGFSLNEEKMITELTQEQKDRFPEFIKKWTDIGLCTKKTDRTKAEKACREAYVVAGLEEPKMILWASSPLGLLMTAKLIKEIAKNGLKPYSDMNLSSVRDSVGASVWDSVRDSVRASVWDSLKKELSELNSWGQHDSNWLGFYDYFRAVCNLEIETSKLTPLSELSKETGWHLFYKNIAILSEKPIEINRNELGQLHRFNGPAIRWNDGYELYRFNGIRIDKKEYLATSEITKDIILKEENADIRREIIKKIGIEKTIEFLGAKVIDSYQSQVGGFYELLSVNYDGRGERPFLKMYNNSIKSFHIEGVIPGTTTVKQAIMYRNGLTEFCEPKELT